MKVIINAAISVDGKIATREGDSNISSAPDLKRVHQLRNKVDVILVGISTVIKDNPSLTVRYNINKTQSTKKKNLIRLIIDSKGRIPLDSKIVQSASQIQTILAVTKNAPKKKLRELEEKGVKIIISKRKNENNILNGVRKMEEKVDLRYIFNQLEKQGISSILVEGGGEINWSIIRDNLFDELIITVSPMIIGGKNAISLVEGEGYKKINESLKIKLKKVLRKDTGEVILYYKNEKR